MSKKINNNTGSKGLSVPLPEFTVTAPKLQPKNKYTSRISNVSYRSGDKTKFTTTDKLQELFKNDYDAYSNLHPDAAKLLVEDRYNIKYLSSPVSTMVPTRETQNNINELAGVKKYNAGLAGILDIAGGASDLFAGSANSKTANTATAASAAIKGASVGAKIGSIIPGAGTFIGAGIGGALSLYESLNQIKEMNFQDKMAKAKEDAISNVNVNNGINAQMQAEYAANNRSNNRVSGFNKGKSSFQSTKANSLVASEEVVRRGDTGELIKVPGRYDPSNPDTVPANINDTDSVYQASSRYIIPGGTSTPSDIMTIAADYQKKAEEIKKSKGASKLRIDTANLNLANIQKQANLLDMNTMNLNKSIENYSTKIGYNKGKASGVTVDPSKGSLALKDAMNLARIPKYSATGTSMTGHDDPMKIFKEGLNTLGSSLSNVAQLAPVFSNLTDNKPEIESPVFDAYINPIQRYNIAEPIRESANQRNIARYNQSVSKQGGSRAFGAEIYSKGVDQTSSIMGQADTANNTYMAQYADRFNQNAASRSNEIRRVNDVNARNRAASNTIKKAGLSQLSEYAQTQELMRNQKSRDNMKMDVFSMYADAMDPKFLAKLQELYNKNQG